MTDLANPMKAITSFVGPNRFLSNFWLAPIHYEGYTYPTVEHAYQAAKTLDEKAKISIKNAETAVAAKRMGRSVKIRVDWDKIKDRVMLELLRLKFDTTGLKERLLATGDAILIEGNTWHDRYWGI